MPLSEIIILLIAAHCYGDFLLQPNGIVENKRKLPVLLIHSGLHGLLAYLVLQQWTLWQAPLTVFIAHTLIDRTKLSLKATPETFALDQGAHLLSLVAIGLAAQYWQGAPAEGAEVFARNWIVGGAGLCAAVLGPGYFIGHVATRLAEKNVALKETLGKGLHGGGAQIGRLERALIFLLMAINYPAGIGFLIAAKSILRFEEAKQQNVAEYVLIGTFWSFGLAIAISWLTLQAMSI